MSATGFPRQPGTGHRQLHDIIERPKDEGAQVSVHHEYDQSPLLSRRVSASPRIQALQQSSAYVFPSYPSPIFEEDVPPAASAQAHSQQAKAAMLAVEGSPDELQVPEPSEGFIIPGSPVSPATPSPPSPEPTATPGSAVTFDTHSASPSPIWDASGAKQRVRGRQRSSVGPNTNFCLPRSYSSGNLRPVATSGSDRQPLTTIPSPRLLPDQEPSNASKPPPLSSDHHLRRARSASCTATGGASAPTIGAAQTTGVVGRQRAGSVRNAVYIPDQHAAPGTLAVNAPSPEPEVLRVSTSTESSRFSAVTSFSAYSGMTAASRYSSDVPLTPDDASEHGTHLQKLYRKSTPPPSTLHEEVDDIDRASIYSTQTDGSTASSAYSLLAQALPANISKSVGDGFRSRPAFISLDEDSMAENSPLEGPQQKPDPFSDARSSFSGGSRRRTKSTPRPPPITTPSRPAGLPNIEIETYPPLPESRPDSRANTERGSQSGSRPGSRRSSRTPMPAAAFALPESRSSSWSRPSSRDSLRHASSFTRSPRGSVLHASAQDTSPYPPVLASPSLRPGHQPRSSSVSSPHSPRFSGVMHSPRSSSLSHVYDDHLQQQQATAPRPSVSRQTSASRLSTLPPRQGFARHASTPALRYTPSPSFPRVRHSPSPSYSTRHSPSPSFNGSTPPRSATRSPRPPSSTASPMPKRTSLRPSASTIAALMSARSSLVVPEPVKPQRATYTRSRTDSDVNYLGGDVMDISAHSTPPSVSEEEDDASVYSNDDEGIDEKQRQRLPPWVTSPPPVNVLHVDSEMAEPFRRATPDPNARLTLVPLEEVKPGINVTLVPPPTTEAPRRTSFGDISDDPFACLSSGATVVSATAGDGGMRPPSMLHAGSASRPSSLVSNMTAEPARARVNSTSRLSASPYMSASGSKSATTMATPDVFSASAESTFFEEPSLLPAPHTPRPRASSRADSARSVRFHELDRPGSSGTTLQTTALAPTAEYEPSILSSKPPSSIAGRSSHRVSYRPSTSDSNKSKDPPRSPPPDFLNSPLFAYQQRPHSSRASSSRGSRESKEKKERLKSEERDRPSTADAVVEDVPSSARKTGFFANFRIRRKHDSFLPNPHSPSPKAQGKQRADAHAPATPTSPPAKGKHGSDKRSHFFS
ncbi:hypothetical protein EV714DRAFT_285660 [Schizophyllum commune]